MIKLILHRQIAASMMFTVAVIGLFLIGCRPADEIETYNVPKEVAPRPVATSTPGEATDRMLAAIVPANDKAWFFKIVGPVAEIDARAAEIESFFTRIRAVPDKTIPVWELPNGWTAQAGSGMRAATLLVPASPKPLELTVTSLPWTGSPAETLSNVNRWRGQMQLAPVDAQGLADCTRAVDAGRSKFTVVDLKGRMQGGGMMAPFAGGAATPQQPPPRTAATDNASQLPPGHPPISNDAPPESMQRTSGPSPLKFDTPTGWVELPPSGMRKAAFGIENGDQKALVTVIDFPIDAGPMMADALENSNRWRREVGLEPLTRETLESQTESIKVDGADARFVAAVPDAATSGQSQADRGTLAAMVQHGDLMWFIKLTGDRDLVAAQRDNFKHFLESLHFTTAGGTSNGN